MNFEPIIKRIKEYKGLRDDQEVAAILGFTKSAFSERKRRESIPKKELELFCERESINIDWLLTGEGTMRKEKPFMVCEKTTTYNNVQSDTEMSEIIQILKEHPQDKGLVLKLLRGRREIKEALDGLQSIETKDGTISKETSIGTAYDDMISASKIELLKVINKIAAFVKGKDKQKMEDIERLLRDESNTGSRGC